MTFKSIYAAHIEKYIAYKRNLGFTLRDVEYVFIQFDRLVLQRDEKTIGITKSLSDAWCVKRPNESDGTRYDRVSKLSLFARYLCNMGYDSYVPEIPKFKASFIPYIFTKDEIERLLAASDHYEPTKIKQDSPSLMAPALFRVLYGTGLRIGEAIELLDKDVDTDNRYVTVRQSKNGTERIVPLSESVSEACEQYRALKRIKIKSRIPCELFFVKNNNTHCSQGAAYKAFRDTIRLAGIPHGGKGAGPRLHDLRHTFACHSLAQMIETGIDPYQAMPLLSTYLGHRTIESTEKYVRLTAEMYPGLLKDIERVCEFVFPRLRTTDYETDGLF
ncbi:MAG: tyrosine-type recombinase/integrase [Prevotella sp.]|jgi:integrase|nr:tyrosine-type recombinase/integrase [Prevotella sp.]